MSQGTVEASPSHTKRTRRGGKAAGFTLIEVLLVLAILVVLGTIAATSVFGAGEKADIDAAKAQVGMFADTIDLYKFTCKKYPEKLDDLINKPSDSDLEGKWLKPFLNKSSIPKDPWNNEYKYSADGKKNDGSFDVWSMGPDGQDGSDDDIGNWES
ncbi:MAG: type II secretion system major pseudopilin GspG [Planctomycetota bacterium]